MEENEEKLNNKEKNKHLHKNDKERYNNSSRTTQRIF